MALPGQIDMKVLPTVKGTSVGIAMANMNRSTANMQDMLTGLGDKVAAGYKEGEVEAGRQTTADIIASINSRGNSLAEAKAMQDDPMYQASSILSRYGDYADNVDVNAIQQAVDGRLTDARQDVFNAGIPSANEVAAQVGTVGAGAKAYEQHLQQQGIDADVMSTELGRYAKDNAYRADTLSADRQNVVDTLMGATSDAEYSESLGVTPAEFEQYQNTQQEKKEKAEDRANTMNIRAENIGPRTQAQINSEVEILSAQQAQDREPAQQRIQAALTTYDQVYGVSQEDFEAIRVSPTGVVGKIQELAGTDSNDIGIVRQKIIDARDTTGKKIYSEKDADTILWLAYQRDPLTADAFLGLDWVDGDFSFDQSALEENVKLVQKSYGKYKEIQDEMGEAAAELESIEGQQAMDLAEYKLELYGGKPSAKKVAGTIIGDEDDKDKDSNFSKLLEQVESDKKKRDEAAQNGSGKTAKVPEKVVYETEPLTALERIMSGIGL